MAEMAEQARIGGSRRKRSALKGKGGVIMMLVAVLLLGGLLLDMQRPARDLDAEPSIAQLLRLSAKDVQRVELKRESGGFVLVRSGDEWVFESPTTFRANPDTVATWLRQVLDDGRINRKLEGAPGDEVTGLDKPVAELTLTNRRGQTRTLQIGGDFRLPDSDLPGSTFYARTLPEGGIFMLAAFNVEDIRDKQVEDLRDKRLLVVKNDSDIQRIRIENEREAVLVERRGEDKWELVEPYRAAAEKWDVENILTQLRSGEAASFADDAATDLAQYGLDKPTLKILLFDKKGQMGLLFGKKDGERVYAMREGEREVALVDAHTFDSLNKKPSDLRDRKLISMASDKIRFVEITNGHGGARLEKGRRDWQLTSAAAGEDRDAAEDAVQRIIDSIRTSASKHVEEAPGDLAKYGLDAPEITVQVNDGKGTSEVYAIGKQTPEGNYYAKGAPNAVFEVPPYVYDDLNVKPDAFKPKPEAETLEE
jgi:hypothetical protein